MSDISTELTGVINALNTKINATKLEYDLMVEMRELITIEYDQMFKQQEMLNLEFKAQIETMKAMHDSIKRAKQENEESRKLLQSEKMESEANLIAESLNKLDSMKKHNRPYKAHTLFSKVFPIGTLATNRK